MEYMNWRNFGDANVNQIEERVGGSKADEIVILIEKPSVDPSFFYLGI